MSRRRFIDQDLLAVWQSRSNARIPANQHQSCRDICDLILAAAKAADPGQVYRWAVKSGAYVVLIPNSTNLIEYEWISGKADRLRYQ